MSQLNWIKDEDLLTEVSQLLYIAKGAKERAQSGFEKNVIDPFSAIFEITGFEMDYATWIKSETARQAQKTLQNHIGNFHQNILGYAPEWTNQKVGNVIDLRSDENRIIAEVKNKYNTISGGLRSRLYHSLDSLVSPKSSIYKGFTAYYVEIIPRKPLRYDIPFTPSDKDKGERCPTNELIRQIDGASFYELVTGQQNALELLFDVLPDAIYEASNGTYKIEDKEKLKTFFNLAYGSQE